MIWIILILIALLVILGLHIFKIPKIGCISMITGGVKSGKSMMSVWFAIRKYRSQRRKWHLKRLLIKFLNIFRKEKLKEPEEPLLYSNVKLAGVKYTLLTNEILLRNVRPAYGSVVYIQEASLMADSQYFRDMTVNERLLLFNKLFGHETHGGYLIYDTQSIQDNHYAVKRCINSYFWIHHMTKIPFFCILHLREFFYSEDNSTVNTVGEDIEESMKLVVIPKRVWKRYDAYCYSAFTDDLPVLNDPVYTKIPGPFKKANLKTKRIITLKKFQSIEEYKEKDNDKKEN